MRKKYLISYYNDITYLPNRRNLYLYLRNKKDFSILLIDLGRLKGVNETYGFIYGDMLLNFAAKEIVRIVGIEGKVFHLQGEEFAIFLRERDPEKIIEWVEDLFEKFKKATIWINGKRKRMPFNLKIGIYISSMDFPETPDDILRKAYLAVMKAKKQKSGNFAFYDTKQDENMKRKMLVIENLEKGIKGKEFYLCYQPVLDLRREEVVGAESLLRWKCFSIGEVSPSDFIPVVEEENYINDLGIFVFKQSCRFLKEVKKVIPSFKININISPIQLENKNFLNQVQEIVENEEVNFKDIKFEITENQILRDEDCNKKTLEKLLNLGSAVVLDDFGSGFSSIKNLVLFPVSEIKIDSFLAMEMMTDKKAEILVSSIIFAAKESGYLLTLEGFGEKLYAEVRYRLKKNDILIGLRNYKAGKLQIIFVNIFIQFAFYQDDC